MTMLSNLLDRRPEVLASQTDPAELLEALQPLTQLTSMRKDAVGYAAAYWVVQTIERVADEESLLLLDRMLALAARRALAHDLDLEFSTRMRTMRDLLEVKRVSIHAALSGRASQLLRAQPILDALSAGPLKQSELRDQLGLTAGRMSQLLAVMEESRLISRQRVGKENIVTRIGSLRNMDRGASTVKESAETYSFRPMDLLAA